MLCGACALASAGVPVLAQEGTAAIGIGQYGVSVQPLDRAAMGQTIASVEIEIAISSGDPARDAAAVRAARAATAGLVGSSYRPVLVDTRLELLVSDAAVSAASYRVVVDGARGALGILVSVDVSYGGSIERAQAVLEEVVVSHPVVLQEPVPNIRVSELADGSVNFIVRPWTKTADYWTVYWDLHRAVKEAFDANGISIPFPQTDMHLHVADSGKAKGTDAVAALTGHHTKSRREVTDYASGDHGADEPGEEGGGERG
jgi:hypothetical protein